MQGQQAQQLQQLFAAAQLNPLGAPMTAGSMAAYARIRGHAARDAARALLLQQGAPLPPLLAGAGDAQADFGGERVRIAASAMPAPVRAAVVAAFAPCEAQWALQAAAAETMRALRLQHLFAEALLNPLGAPMPPGSMVEYARIQGRAARDAARTLLQQQGGAPLPALIVSAGDVVANFGEHSARIAGSAAPAPVHAAVAAALAPCVAQWALQA